MPKKQEPRTKPLPSSELINRLDSLTHIQGGVARKDKEKMSTGLHATKAPTVSPVMIGTNETIAVNILSHLSDALESRKMKRIFTGIRDIGDVIQFEHCHVNLDLSHCYVYWTSNVCDHFATFVAEKKGEEEAEKALTVMYENTSKKLQSVEGYFRHALIQQMDFRRVPRIFFEPYAKYLEKMRKKTGENSNRMEFLQKEGHHSTL